MLTLNCASDDVIEHSSKASTANAWRMMGTSGLRGPPKAGAVRLCRNRAVLDIGRPLPGT
jgi:hypothetical protein